MQNPTQALKSVKGPGNIFDLNHKWERTLASFGNFSWDIHSPSKTKSKYQSWYLTLCCGLEVQNPTQALKSVKGPGNTFDISPKWERTLSSFDNFSWDIYRVPPKKNSKYQSWYLTPCCGLEVQNPTLTLKSVKGLGITFELNPRWERTLPSFGNFAWDIHRVPPNSNNKVDIWHSAVDLRCRIPPRHLDKIKTRVILFGRGAL